ncbi:MAG TPA: serine/threonine-protein kinase, partial [Labilithrix sp.]|nr:serine/threonine-protein kinase [Labilithrix sp.]
MNHAIDPFGIVGQVLDGQFRVERLVGEGGFSAVYRGHHLGLNEPIAVKCLKLPPSLSPPLVDEFAKRFRDESRILYRLSQGNLNIVRSIAAGTWQANTGLVVPYMILEWLDGRSVANEFTIRRTVGQQGRPLGEVVKMFTPAADGLGYAHSQGVLHRDLNPGNLFLASTPQGHRMKVLDFGVAKILDDSTIDIARTQTVGQVRIFAPAYGAPEQFDDTIGPVGAASDVYSFALILLEALRDRPVNEGQHLADFTQRAIDPKQRRTPRALGIDVSDEVEQVFARATAFDPRERWQSAGELWQALTLASSAASEKRHAQAALETPPLAMPKVMRGTQKGMAPPPQPNARLNKTVPLGAVMPDLGLLRTSKGVGPAAQAAPALGAAPAPAPALGAAPAPPPSEPRSSSARRSVPQLPPASVSAPEPFSQQMTVVGPVPVPAPPAAVQPPSDVAAPPSEEDVTRVSAPEADILRGLAESDARSAQAPRPAAGAPAPSMGLGGTLMMSPGGYGPPPSVAAAPQAAERRPLGQALASTLPLSGQHPL